VHAVSGEIKPRAPGAQSLSSICFGESSKAGTFETTHWSVVLMAKENPSPMAHAALARLCRSYWYPLYAFVRRCGYPRDEAQDLTQGFFERLLENDYLNSVERGKGRFRSFLLAALEHFLANEWRRSQARKRGGGIEFISWEGDSAEEQFSRTAAWGLSAEKSYDRQWALTLLEQVLARLRQEFRAAGKAALFEELKIFLTGEKPEISYALLGQKLGSTEAAVKMTVSRIRYRYGKLLREEIARTVATPEEVEDELHAFFRALS
jgi:RNA polymerase sigma factor (sigma-70 family)